MPECSQGRYGAPEAEAQQGGVFVGCFTGGAAGSAQIHDWLNPEGNRTADFQGHCHTIRTKHEGERPIREYSFTGAERYLELFTRLQPVVRIRGTAGSKLNLFEIVQFGQTSVGDTVLAMIS